jgi:WD40 repeat protein
LLCGFDDGYLSIFDLNKLAFVNSIKTFASYKANEVKDINRSKLQANYLVKSSSEPLVYGGFEDNTIKTFDMRLNENALTNSITAHTDSVTSLTLFSDIYLFSTSHDSIIKMWDVRNLNSCVQETTVIFN